MKKILLTPLLLLILITSLSASQVVVTYLEGDVDIRTSKGLSWADIGDSLQPGDTIITGADGQAILKEGKNTEIKISPNTAFTIRGIEKNKENRRVMACLFGSMRFSFKRVFGKEPLIGTPSGIGGIRGTEFTVFAAEDGSSMIQVEKGLVVIKDIELGAGEGIEIKPGGTPGEKFKTFGRPKDFSSWNNKRLDAMMGDPLKALLQVEKRLAYYKDRMNSYLAIYKRNMIVIDKLRKKMLGFMNAGKNEEAKRVREDEFFPLSTATVLTATNMRYYALSYLSMRQYILSKMYLKMKSIYMNDLKNKVFVDYGLIHNRIKNDYEKIIVPNLVEDDF